jgi:hypothetical protein
MTCLCEKTDEECRSTPFCKNKTSVKMDRIHAEKLVTHHIFPGSTVGKPSQDACRALSDEIQRLKSKLGVMDTVAKELCDLRGKMGDVVNFEVTTRAVVYGVEVPVTLESALAAKEAELIAEQNAVGELLATVWQAAERLRSAVRVESLLPEEGLQPIDDGSGVGAGGVDPSDEAEGDADGDTKPEKVAAGDLRPDRTG